MLKKDPFYMKQILPNAMTALAYSDYEQAFDALEQDDWTIEKLLEAKKNNWDGLDELTRFHAVLSYDAVFMTAAMEALQDTPKLSFARGMLKKAFSRVSGGVFQPIGFELPQEQIILNVYSKNDRLNKLKFGQKTKAIFPDIEDTLKHNEDSRLSRSIIHEIERRAHLADTDADNPHAIDPTTVEGKSLLHHIACAHRTLGPKNMEVLLDHTGFQSDDTPVFDRVLCLHPGLQKRVKLDMELYANDNVFPAGSMYKVA